MLTLVNSNRVGTGTAAIWKEWRRLRAIELHDEGWTQASIAKALGVTEAAVSQWMKLARDGGKKALRSKSRRGQAVRLSQKQLQLLPEFLDLGPGAFGFSGELWTCPRIARLIEQEFGVVYHPDHVRRLMHQLGWSYQKPIVRAAERDETVICEWLERSWPQIERKPKRRAG
jgi:transposase